MAQLPADSIYRETCKLSLLQEVADLWRRSAQAASKAQIAGRIDAYAIKSANRHADHGFGKSEAA